jgi:hypothetical protein
MGNDNPFEVLDSATLATLKTETIAAEANVEGSRILDEIREVVNGGLARFQADVVKQSKGRDDDE